MYHIAYVCVYNYRCMALKAAAQPQNKHQRKTAETRRKLLNAALRVFAKSGFEASRIEDIAAEAGHTRGAFYANFDTKEDLFFALLEQQASRRIKDLQTRLELCDSAPERLRGLREFYLERAGDRQWVLLTVEFKLFALRHAKLRAKLAAAHQRIRASLNYDNVTKLLRVKRWDALTEESTKLILEVILAGLVLEHAYDPGRVSKEQVSRSLGRVFDILMGNLE